MASRSSSFSSLRSLLWALPLLPALAAGDCQPVTTQANFELQAFASKRWYVQQQAQTKYLPATQNFCVYAEYELLEKKTFWGYSVQVHNHAEEKNHTVHDSGKYICASSADKEDPAKLAVGPCFLPRIGGYTTGPYWVLAYDEAEGYALISGGQPTVETKDGCRSGEGVNGSGLWIFTRNQQRDEQLVQKVRSLAKQQGFDLSVLNDVDQTEAQCSRRTAGLQAAAAAGGSMQLLV